MARIVPTYGGPNAGAAFLKILQDILAFLQHQLLQRCSQPPRWFEHARGIRCCYHHICAIYGAELYSPPGNLADMITLTTLTAIQTVLPNLFRDSYARPRWLGDCRLQKVSCFLAMSEGVGHLEMLST